MNVKEELVKLRGKLKNSKEKNEYVEEIVQPLNYDLNDKVSDFINWFQEKKVNGNYTNIGEYHEPQRLKDFIEKMATWYELRYPEYEVNRMFPCSGQERMQIDAVMFKDNNYINNKVNENYSEEGNLSTWRHNKNFVEELDWEKFYNTKTLINSLPWNERVFLKRPKYPTKIELGDKLSYLTPYVKLSSNGIVLESHYFPHIPGLGAYCFDLFKGMRIEEMISYLKKKEIDFPELEKAVKKYEEDTYFKNELLNCIMYRIIERGGNRIGPRRGFIFAKEFKMNIDIPMIYGVDYSDPGLRNFINEYLKAGGSKNLQCIECYFSKSNKNEDFNLVSMQELIDNTWDNRTEKYTSEEKQLQQRLTDSLISKKTLLESNKQLVKVKK